MTLTFGSLFAGIGGIDLGFERAGMVCKWQVEIDDYCQRVLKKHWPEVKRYGDIKEVRGVMAHSERNQYTCSKQKSDRETQEIQRKYRQKHNTTREFSRTSGVQLSDNEHGEPIRQTYLEPVDIIAGGGSKI